MRSLPAIAAAYRDLCDLCDHAGRPMELSMELSMEACRAREKDFDTMLAFFYLGFDPMDCKCRTVLA